MSAFEALKVARAGGIKVVLDGGDLVLMAAEEPAATVLSELSRYKSEIVALLRTEDGSDADWLTYFDERAAIAEFDGGLQRSAAEACAFECCVVEWLNRNPVNSPPGRCLHCGGSEGTLDELVPFGIEPTGHAWLHSRCWAAWHETRRATAVAVLSPLLKRR